MELRSIVLAKTWRQPTEKERETELCDTKEGANRSSSRPAGVGWNSETEYSRPTVVEGSNSETKCSRPAAGVLGFGLQQASSSLETKMKRRKQLRNRKCRRGAGGLAGKHLGWPENQAAATGCGGAGAGRQRWVQ